MLRSRIIRLIVTLVFEHGGHELCVGGLFEPMSSITNAGSLSTGFLRGPVRFSVHPVMNRVRIRIYFLRILNIRRSSNFDGSR